MTTFTPDAEYLPFDPSPSKPAFVLPPGSVDVHTHVFGPGDRFPYAPERKYTPVDAPKEVLFQRQAFLGVDRTVIVQATCHGADNSALVDALRTAGDRARGIATVRDDVTDDTLAELHDAGVRGVRFNFVRRLVDPRPDSYYRAIAERVAALGWHVVAYFEPADLDERWELFTTLPTDVVVDHMGRPDVTASPDGREFERFRTIMRDHPHVWCKVTCPDRLTATGPPYDDVLPFASTLVHEFGDRVLWGTDWPHPNLKSHMPDDGQLVDLIPRVTSDTATQHAWLVDNPARLYWT